MRTGRWPDVRSVALGFGLVLWSIVARALAAAAAGSPAFYFPDSWNYVALPATGRAHPFHGPFIYSVWDRLWPGTPTEADVVRLHQLIGIAAVLVVWSTLRRLVSEPVALGVSVVLAAQPLSLFFERTILTEAVALALVAGILAALSRLTVASGPWVMLVAAVVLGSSSGLLVALRPASRLVAAVPLALGVVMLVRRVSHASGRSRLAALAGLGLLVVSLMPAPLHVRARNADNFDTASLTPASGTAMAAWWTWRLDCPDSSDRYTPEAEAALATTCLLDDEPQQQLMWTSRDVNRSMQPHAGFAETQAQLSRASTEAMLSSPLYVARRTVSQSLKHAVDPTVNISRFGNGHTWFSADALDEFPTRDDWFGGDERTRLRADPGLFGLVRQSARIPGLVSLGAVALLIVLAWRGRVRFRGGFSVLFDRPRVVMLVASLGALAGNEAVVALGGVPIFRYWVPVLPAVAIVAAIAIDAMIGGYAEGSSAPHSTG